MTAELAEWQQVRIRDLAKIVGGGTPSRKDPSLFGGNVPWITPKDLSRSKSRFVSVGANNLTDEGLSRSSARLVPRRTVLFSSRAPIGYVALARQPLATNQGFRSLVCDEALSLPEFVFYSLKAHVPAIESIASGATFKEVSGRALGAFAIPLPSLATQRKIAELLSAYDDLIENSLRRIELLEVAARHLYREWFVEFRFPGHERARFVDSPFGRIPRGWNVVSIRDVAEVLRGKSYRGRDVVEEGGVPFVSLKCVERDGGFRSSGLKAYAGPFGEGQKVRNGDVVVAITDMNQERRVVARAARVPRLGADFGVMSMDLVRVASRGGLPAEFLYSVLRWSRFPDEVKQQANGANVLHLLPARIGDWRFVCPPEDLADGFRKVVSPLFVFSDTLEEKNSLLSQVRDLLLPKLISGDLDVSDLAVRTRPLYAGDPQRLTEYRFFREIAALPFVEKIALFGSRARGDHEERSDIDLCVFCGDAGEDEWLEVLACLERDRVDTLLKVDCTRFEASNAPMRENVLTEGIVLFERKEGP
ncbi:MAG: restriction endonuclease subunit S [Acidobacteria bacterium]|nr:restriction endonuclease subunit S [Acidobacteriota bacterium]